MAEVRSVGSHVNHVFAQSVACGPSKSRCRMPRLPDDIRHTTSLSHVSYSVYCCRALAEAESSTESYPSF